MGSTSDLGPKKPEYFNDDEDAPTPIRREAFRDDRAMLPIQLVYWLMLLFLCSVTAFLTFVNSHPTMRTREGFLYGGFLAVMVLPGLQLGASLLTSIVILIFYPDKDRPFHRVGRITLYSFIGGLIGIVAMGGCCGVFSLPGLLR